MQLKKYSRPLDLLLASVESYRKGDTELAGRFFIRAAKHQGIDAVLSTLDRMNEQAASQSKEMSDAIKKAEARLIQKAEEEKEEEKEESTDSELDLEMSADDDDADDNEEEGHGDMGDDLDTILDGIDDEESTTETHEDPPTEDVKEGETSDAGKDSPEGPDNLNDETPAPDKNEPAKTAAKAKAKEKAKPLMKKAEAKKGVKSSDERTKSVARNLKILARLSVRHTSKK